MLVRTFDNFSPSVPIYRATAKQTYRQIGRKVDRQIGRQVDMYVYGKTDRQTEIDGQTDRQIDGQRQTGRQIDGRLVRQVGYFVCQSNFAFIQSLVVRNQLS